MRPPASPAVYGPMVPRPRPRPPAQAAGAKAGADYFAANSPAAVAALGTAATELVALVKTQIIGKGANFVVVNNMPDIGTTPFGRVDRRQHAGAGQRDGQGLQRHPAAPACRPKRKWLYVDTFAASHDQATNPAPYGLTNVTTPACDLTAPKNPLGSSLVCNGSNLIAGDVSHYSFADAVHPTPFVQLLLARYVSKYMVQKGWL